VIARFESTLEKIASAVDGTLLHGEPSRTVATITSDSRETAEKSLFVPITGENYDGHSFIEPLCRSQKIDCFLTTRPEDVEIARSTGVGAVLCENTLYALGALARAYRSQFFMPVIGVTGTNGKTTTKELIACALSVKGSVMKSEKNYNNEIGVPFTLMGLLSQHDFAVIEMGMNHTGEISRLSAMSMPDAAVITNAGEGHLEFLSSVENVARAKSEIMEPMKPGSLIVLNEDSECFDIMRSYAEKKKLLIKTVGLTKGMFRPESYTLGPDYTEVVCREITFTVPLYGIHNVQNILMAIVVAEHFGAELLKIADAFKSFQNVGKRSDLTEGRFTVVNDTYNSNPLSLRYALRSLAEVYPDRKKIAVLSDMKELGRHSKRCHLAAGSEVFDFGFDELLTFGDMSRWIYEGARNAGMPADAVTHYYSKDDMVRALRSMISDGDAVLVKGSRSMKMEEVADTLLQLK
jgi:UDP-N-acetylmuramoyl-tripeptide--D-alanyl-D-alanine ligase